MAALAGGTHPGLLNASPALGLEGTMLGLSGLGRADFMVPQHSCVSVGSSPGRGGSTISLCDNPDFNGEVLYTQCFVHCLLSTPGPCKQN
jgi:hypothetical protein